MDEQARRHQVQARIELETLLAEDAGESRPVDPGATVCIECARSAERR